MASQVITSLARLAETNPPGVKRSRFSLHFNTPRVRRWLLVQLVSVPAVSAEEPKSLTYRQAPDRSNDGNDYGRLLDDYQNGRMLRQCM